MRRFRHGFPRGKLADTIEEQRERGRSGIIPEIDAVDDSDKSHLEFHRLFDTFLFTRDEILFKKCFWFE